MKISWTTSQRERLAELCAAEAELDMQFENAPERDSAFQALETSLVKEQRRLLGEFRQVARRPALCRMESRLSEVLAANQFVQVATPTIMSRGLLAKMAIDENHPLASQIYWLDQNKCLRPMLAPHLYYVLKDLLRLWESPVRIFEIGSCFRKESRGSQHTSEFTMLNLVEMGLPMEQRRPRLEAFTAMVAEAAGIADYRLTSENSAVYGETIDIVAGPQAVEIGSAAMGPHSLDRHWQITAAWVGIGFGLERMLMVASGSRGLARMGRSLAYLDGIRLNI